MKFLNNAPILSMGKHKNTYVKYTACPNKHCAWKNQ